MSSPEPSPSRAGEPAAQFLAEIREQPARARAPARRTSASSPGSRRRRASAGRDSCASSATARRTTPPRTASTRSACCRGWTALRDSITLTRLLRRPARPVRLDGDRRSRSPAARRTSSSTWRARARGGAFTVAVTNDPDSDLPERRRGACSPSAPDRSRRSPRRRRTSTSSPRSPCSPRTPPARGARYADGLARGRRPARRRPSRSSSARRRARARRSPSSAGCS